jgi:hypothetical protein
MEHLEQDRMDLLDREISRIIKHSVYQFQPRTNGKSLVARIMELIGSSPFLYSIAPPVLPGDKNVVLNYRIEPCDDSLRYGPLVWGFVLKPA